MTLLELFETARKDKGLRKADVARALDLDASYFNKLESKGDKMPVYQAERIAKAMGMTLAELFSYGQAMPIGNQGEIREGGTANHEAVVRQLEEVNRKAEEAQRELKSLKLTMGVILKEHASRLARDLRISLPATGESRKRLAQALFSQRWVQEVVKANLIAEPVILDMWQAYQMESPELNPFGPA